MKLVKTPRFSSLECPQNKYRFYHFQNEYMVGRIADIYLKFKQWGLTLGHFVQKMQME